MSEHHASSDQQGHGAHAAHHHIVPLPVYFTIFATLLVLTGVTVAVAFVDLGPFNIYVALAIAIFKATLVVLYFMHVKYSSKLVQLAAVTGFLWMGIMLAFTFADIGTRDWQGVQGWAPQPIDGAVMGGEGHGGAAEGEQAGGTAEGAGH